MYSVLSLSLRLKRDGNFLFYVASKKYNKCQQKVEEIGLFFETIVI